MPVFSIIVPIYNNENEVEEWFNAFLKKVNLGGEIELIFVNDGSTDLSKVILQRLTDNNNFVKVINLDGNYGNDACYSVGMAKASGKACILYNLDNKNTFESINQIASKWLKGNQIAYGYRVDKKTASFKVFEHRLFKTLCKMFGIKNDILPKPQIELYDKEVVLVLNSLVYKQTYLRNTNSFVEYKIATFEFLGRTPSKSGIEKYNKKKEENKEFKKANVNVMENDVMKRVRPYATKFLLSSIFLLVSFVTLTAGIILDAFNIIDGIMLFAIILVAVSFLLASVLVYISGAIVKRLGTFKVSTEKLPYQIDELIGFETIFKDVKQEVFAKDKK